MSVMKEINLLVKKAQQLSPEEQAIVDRYVRLFGPAFRSRGLRDVKLRREAAALKSSGPGVTTRNPDGSTTTRWSGYLQGGVTRQQAERSPDAAQKWNMAQQARDVINASSASRSGLNTMPNMQTPNMQTMPNMQTPNMQTMPNMQTPNMQTMPNRQKSPMKSKTVVAPGAEEFL